MGDYFGNDYFAVSYFGDGYFGPETVVVPPGPSPGVTPGSGASHPLGDRILSEDDLAALIMLLES